MTTYIQLKKLRIRFEAVVMAEGRARPWSQPLVLVSNPPQSSSNDESLILAQSESTLLLELATVLGSKEPILFLLGGAWRLARRGWQSK